MRNWRDDDANELIKDLPTHVPDVGEYPKLNAYVCLNTNYNPPRLEIWPYGGGWLGVESNTLQGDIAPWHG